MGAPGMNVRDRIVAQRRARIERQGHDMGAALPTVRTVPLFPFGAPPFLVCEVKRRSPSRGAIAADMDAVAQARLYAERGVRSVSVLTEQDNFGGSLDDLVRIKEALPGLSVLRKDFLLDREDVDASWRAGADAVLLIAAMLDASTLAALHARARELGMQVLVEVHDQPDVEKCRPFSPPLTGVNCRDLATFEVDLLHPLRLRPHLSWPTRLLFESGVRGPEDVLVARSAGYEGVLVGETAVRSPDLIPGLLSAFAHPATVPFWPRLCARMRPGRPLVKICGIARAADAEKAVKLGADALGFIFAASPRRALPSLLRDLRGLDVLKVAVVVTPRGQPALDPDVSALLSEGLIDAVQLHGEESPEQCASLAFPYYKAVRVRGLQDVSLMDSFLSPRVLADAWSADAAGGTGKRIEPGLAREARKNRPLWLAGGIGPDNVGEILRDLSPELIDASSRLEESPGRKDHAQLERYFEEIRRHGEV
jgi:indole-3-glycerol phosphate synthase/phosphoribosylanthranilate isomerase